MEEKTVLNLNLDDILPNRFQPRIRFDEDAISELADSIKEHGVIQPIIVRTIGDKYEIIAGERRYKASVMAGNNEIPAIVENFDDKKSAEIALIENVQRQDLTPIEEAVSYKKILDMGYLTQEDLARKIDKKQSTVSNKLRLLNLADEVQEALLNEKISERHARSLLKLNKEKDQITLLNRILDERLTVRKTDIEIKKMNEEDNMTTEVESEEKVSVNSTIDIENLKIPSTPIIEDIEEISLDDIMDEDEDNEEIDRLLEGTSNTEEDIINIEDTDNEEEFEFNSEIMSDFEDLDFEEKEEEKDTDVGFLDIDNIVETAEDIKLEEEKEEVDIEKLLKGTSEKNKEEKIALNSFNTGKFFSFPIDEEKEEIDEEPPSDLLKDFDFDNSIETNSNKIDDAINIVKDCAKKIEANGFKVETNEEEFDNYYQVTLKINKENI